MNWSFFFFSKKEKRILELRKGIPWCAISGGLGSFPLGLIAEECYLKYWLKLLRNQDSPLFSVHSDQYDTNVMPVVMCWQSTVSRVEL